ncbi:MAG: hypothetical protein WBD31_12255, partial [Rubripirellula sp.]
SGGNDFQQKTTLKTTSDLWVMTRFPPANSKLVNSELVNSKLAGGNRPYVRIRLEMLLVARG